MIIASALVLAFALVLFVVAYDASGRRVLRSRTRRNVLVTTKSGGWFTGLLHEHDRQSIVLRQARAESDAGESAVVDGEVVILMVDVAHIQFP